MKIIIVTDGDYVLIAKTCQASLAIKNTEVPTIFANLLP